MWDFYGKIWGTLGKCGKHLGRVVGTSGENLGKSVGFLCILIAKMWDLQGKSREEFYGICIASE
jgi:hypothetical protein